MLLAWVACGASAVAGTWSQTPWTGDSTTGIHASTNVWAYRFGSATTATVNGVTVPGSPFSLTSANVDVTLTSSYQGAVNNLTALGGTGSALLAQDFVYNGVQGPLTATVKNLTVGQNYVVSFFGVGFDADAARNVNFTSGSDSLVVNQNHYGLGNGIRVDYTFTAEAATRGFTLMETVPFYSWGLNAIALSRSASAPTAATGAAGGVFTTTATLAGSINANGADTTVTFQYGLTTSYGSTVTAAQSPVTGETDVAVSAAVSGLTPGTTYHYRVVGQNFQGTTPGADATFTTPATNLGLYAPPANGADVYVADGTNHKIVRYTSSGTLVGDFATSATGINGPSSLAFDSAGNLYVGNNGDGTLWKYAPNGTGSLFATVPDGVWNMAFDADGNLYVSNFGTAITKISPSGTNLGNVDNFSGSHTCLGVAFDAAGTLWAGDHFAFSINRYPPGQAATRHTQSAVNNPRGLAFDTAGNLFVANIGNTTISKYAFTGGALSTTGSVFATTSGFNPLCLAFDSTGNLYATANNSGVVGKYSSTGSYLGAFATVSGSSLIRGIAFSPLADAPMVSSPTSTSVTATGATLGGNVTADGGASITERGVVYSATATNSNPAIGGSGVTKVTAPGTTGVFTTGVSGLTTRTSYSFKAYAINGAGTSYSDTGTFSTPNTLPTAPNGNATGTTGDPNTVTISFPATDADGDAVAITGAVSGTGIMVDSFTATTVTFTPAASFTGDGSFTYTVGDGFGGTATGTITVAVTDNDAPVAGAPTEGFTLLALTVDAGTGVVDLPDYRSQVVALDNVGVVSLAQAPAPGSVLGQGPVQVSITAEDAAGNVSDALVLTVVVGPAVAPVAGWSFTAWTGDSSTGIHASSNVWAHRFGSAATATVNGVTVPGSPFSLTSADVDVTLTSSFQGAVNNLTALGGTGSALLAQDFVYNGVQGPLTATVKNLTVGQKYAVSFFGVGFDAGVARSVNFTSGADSQVVNQNHYGLGNGIRVDYHFTATAATRAFTLMETAPLYSWGLNAITLRKVSVPDLVTDAATDVTTESATLNATVNPDGLAATAHFEYGLTTAYGSTAAITLSPADGSSAQAVSAPVSGLTAGRTYHYRVALTNLHGTFYGDDQTFSTVQIPSLFALSARTISVPQGSASVMIPLHRTGGSHAAGVQLSTVDGTASAVPPFAAGLAAKDYQALTTTVDFAEGEMQKEVEITLIPRAGTNVPNTRFQVILTGAGWDDIPADPKLGHPITATVQVLANDTTAPTLTVKTPANGATLNHAPPVIITGTVGDKYGIDRVEIEHGGELIEADLGSATRSTSIPFSGEIYPAADGPVTFTVTAYDLNGNSTVVTRAFNHVRWYDVVVSRSVPGGLATPEAAGMVTLASTKGSFSTLQPARGSIDQQGSVLPGAPVTLTARPAAGHVFSHWEGLPVDAVMSGAVASFTMPAEDVTEILAVFVANPFAALGTTAVFHGLLAPHQTQRSNAALGSLNATLTTSTGALSGKLLLGGVTTSFAGTVQGNGDVWLKNAGGPMTGALEIPGIGTLVLFFASDSLDISLFGADTDSFGTARAAIHSAANPVPATLLNDAKQGFYTVALPALEQTPSKPASTYPQGAGYGTLTLKTNGTLTLAGVLADGSKFTAASALVSGNTSPVHAQLPTPGSATLKGGSLLGMLAFDPDAPDTDVSSASLGWAVFGGKGGPPPESGSGLLWLRPGVVQQTGTTAAALATQLYTEGWEQGITVGLVGALYDKAVTVQSALGLPAAGPDGNAVLAFEDGKLLDTVAYTTLNVDGGKVVKLPSTDKRYTLTLTGNTGAMKGAFTPFWSNPGTALPAFNGVILQKGANKGGWGHFISNRQHDLDPQSGSVTLGAQP